MSIRENIEIYTQLDPQKYVEILKKEYGAREHPSQPDGYIIDDPELPFYRPKTIEDHISILSFNYTPLSILLIQAIIDHPELVPDEVLVRWTQEQDLIMENTLGDLRRQSRSYDTR